MNEQTIIIVKKIREWQALTTLQKPLSESGVPLVKFLNLSIEICTGTSECEYVY